MKILVINPNSAASVTRGIAAALAPLGDHFAVTDLPQSPATIASDEDVARAGIGVAELVQKMAADAYVTACFSDPGLDLARSLTGKPVFGIQEAGILTAMARADLFGIIALGPKSIPRHRRKIRMMGVEARLAGELALSGVSAEASGRDETVYAEVRATAERLGEMGAGAIVLGCAGMAPIRARLESDTGLIVIDPVMAGGAMALGSVLG
ncbi:aspartate/glutamate racemase family protein [Puniceibacterium sediminis]|uniref:Asp/Glu/hydantoin racemase n=1 Tax=Puniceibacterium sediminis TaxID=1608407 RepID=A0A238YBW4_9RHOB|nr:aspartate/glutamate racemase family protein [Puniceibacterium sediminis]SNR68776.1 Asp/Glu/hydantoin racemase [Puniceibacterium sediminis]